MSTSTLKEKQLQDLARFLNGELSEIECSAFRELLTEDSSFLMAVESLAHIETMLSDALAINHSLSAPPKEPPPWALLNLERCRLLLLDRKRTNPIPFSLLDVFRGFGEAAASPEIQEDFRPLDWGISGAGVMSDPELSMKPPILARDLATQLNLEPFRLIHELMEMNVFATLDQELEEAVVKKICDKHGFLFRAEKCKE